MPLDVTILDPLFWGSVRFYLACTTRMSPTNLWQGVFVYLSESRIRGKEMREIMRYAFKLRMKSGTEDEYVRRHRSVYPELLQVFQKAGVKTYSIFLDGTTLFAYMEMDNPEETLQIINEAEINAKWQDYMSDILVPIGEGQTTETLPEVFHFEANS